MPPQTFGTRYHATKTPVAVCLARFATTSEQLQQMFPSLCYTDCAKAGTATLQNQQFVNHRPTETAPPYLALQWTTAATTSADKIMVAVLHNQQFVNHRLTAKRAETVLPISHCSRQELLQPLHVDLVLHNQQFINLLKRAPPTSHCSGQELLQPLWI